jgi:hypothetical protein
MLREDGFCLVGMLSRMNRCSKHCDARYVRRPVWRCLKSVHYYTRSTWQSRIQGASQSRSSLMWNLGGGNCSQPTRSQMQPKPSWMRDLSPPNKLSNGLNKIFSSPTNRRLNTYAGRRHKERCGCTEGAHSNGIVY